MCSRIVVSCHATYYSTLNQRLAAKTFIGKHKNNGSSYGHQRKNDLLVPLGPRGWTIPPNRSYGMFVVRILRGALKLRYVLLGSAIGGGVTLSKVRKLSNCFVFLNQITDCITTTEI